MKPASGAGSTCITEVRLDAAVATAARTPLLPKIALREILSKVSARKAR